jgi:uroporphyrinogen-III synthase
MKGKKVLITRSTEDNKNFREQLEKKGAQVTELPMIQFELSKDLTVIHEQLERLETIDWIVFTSAKTVEFFFQIAASKGIKFYYYPDLKIATVGEKTKLKLEQLGYRTNFVPIQYTAEVLAENMDENIEGKNILIPQSNLASKEYFQVFEKRGANPIPAIIYQTLPVIYSSEAFETVMSQQIDYLTFTSGSTFDAFYMNLLHSKVQVESERIICIGPSTAKAVAQKEHKVSAIAAPHTTEGMIKALEKLEDHV